MTATFAVGAHSSWRFEKRSKSKKSKNGAGIRILTETITSPSMSAQFQVIRKTFPGAKWHQWEPTGAHSARAGATQTFGQPVNTYYDFSAADVVVSLDSDFLASGPGSLRYARQFSMRRRVTDDGGTMNRLYVVEAMPTPTGAKADHRLPLRAGDIEEFAWALATGVQAANGPKKGDNEAIYRYAGPIRAGSAEAQRIQRRNRIHDGSLSFEDSVRSQSARIRVDGRPGLSSHGREPLELDHPRRTYARDDDQRHSHLHVVLRRRLRIAGKRRAGGEGAQARDELAAARAKRTGLAGPRHWSVRRTAHRRDQNVGGDDGYSHRRTKTKTTHPASRRTKSARSSTKASTATIAGSLTNPCRCWEM